MHCSITFISWSRLRSGFWVSSVLGHCLFLHMFVSSRVSRVCDQLLIDACKDDKSLWKREMYAIVIAIPCEWTAGKTNCWPIEIMLVLPLLADGRTQLWQQQWSLKIAYNDISMLHTSWADFPERLYTKHHQLEQGRHSRRWNSALKESLDNNQVLHEQCYIRCIAKSPVNTNANTACRWKSNF